MVSKGPRSSDPRNREVSRYDDEFRDNPPVLIWQTVPHTGGLRVAVYIHDPQNPPGRKSRTPCACNLYGSPKRKQGPHHEDDCGRYAA